MSRVVLHQMVSSSFTCLVPGLGWLEHLEAFMGAVEGRVSVGGFSTQLAWVSSQHSGLRIVRILRWQLASQQVLQEA